ncbi:MAG: DUF3857 domain-containing protein [Cyclobacteriaceae bacterium]
MMRKIIALLSLSIPLVLFSQDVIVNNSETVYTIESMESLLISEYKKVTILREEGYKHAVYVNAEDKFSKVTKLRMTVYDRNGKKVKKIGKAESQGYGFNPQNSVDDTRVLVLEPNYQSYPFTILIEAETRFGRGFMNIPSWMPQNDFRVEVKSAKLLLNKPKDFDLNIYEEGQLTSTKKTMDKTETFAWEINALDAVDNDISRNQFYQNQPKVIIAPKQFVLDGYEGSFENWATYGNWFHELNSDPYELTQETKSFLDQLEDEHTLAQVQQIYKYMQSRTRYVSIQLGIGGFKSLPANFVDEKGFGDCKALTNYMKSMLDYKGVKSNFILVRAGSEAMDVREDMISYQFNHVFLGIPTEEDTMYLECTSQITPTGFLGTFTDDRNVLWIEKDKSQIMRSPIYDEDVNILRTSCDMEMDEYGNAKMVISRENGGLFYDDIMLYKSITDEQREEFIYSKFDFKDFTISDFTYGERKDESPVYASKMNIVVNNLARNTSNKLLVPVSIFPEVDTYFVHNSYKKYVDIKRAFTIEDKVIVKMPENFWVNRVPEITPFSNDYGSYECNVKDLENGSVEIERKVILRKGSYSGEDFDSFNTFLNEIKKADKSKLILQAGT